MQFNFYRTLVCLVGLFLCTNQKSLGQISDRQERGFSDRVKSVRITEYKVNGPENSKKSYEPEHVQEYTFSRQGKELAYRSENVHKDGEKTIWERDSTGSIYLDVCTAKDWRCPAGLYFSRDDATHRNRFKLMYDQENSSSSLQYVEKDSLGREAAFYHMDFAPDTIERMFPRERKRVTQLAGYVQKATLAELIALADTVAWRSAEYSYRTGDTIEVKWYRHQDTLTGQDLRIDHKFIYQTSYHPYRKKIFSYDSLGRTTSETVVYRTGDTIERTVWEHYIGPQIRSVVQRRYDKVIEVVETRWNDKEFDTIVTTRNGEGFVLSESKYQYDGTQLIRAQYMHHNPLMATTSIRHRTWTKSGQPIDERFKEYIKGVVKRELNRTYLVDENGDLTEMRETSPRGYLKRVKRNEYVYYE